MKRARLVVIGTAGGEAFSSARCCKRCASTSEGHRMLNSRRSPQARAGAVEPNGCRTNCHHCPILTSSNIQLGSHKQGL